jgi:hypothetical protein
MPKLENTYKKLQNCRYILKELELHEKEPEKFDALIESFIDCARSITFILTTEYQRKGLNLEDWYKKKGKEMESPENNLLSFFKDTRTIVTHQGTVGIGTAAYIEHMEVNGRKAPKGWGFAITGRGEAIWIKDAGTPNPIKIHASEFDKDLAIKHFIVNPPLPLPLKLNGLDCSYFDALTLCKLYFAYLEDLVYEAEKMIT